MSFPRRTGGARIAAAACVVFLFGVVLAVSAARAQSDAAAVAPWQAHPCEGQQVPPPDQPCCDGDGSCGIGLGHRRASCRTCGDSPCGEGPCADSCDGQPDVACDWLRMFEPCGQLWFRGEYIAWWTKTTNYPALVTSGTQALYSGSAGDPGTHSGGRVNMGYWFTPCHETGLDVTYTFLGNTAATFYSDDKINANLGRPYYDVNPNDPLNPRETALVIAAPNVATGSITVTNAQELNFMDALFRCSVLQDCCRQFDFLFGYRYGRFVENLDIDGTSNSALGFTTRKTDEFAARNEFNGFEMGMVSTTRYCRWSLDVLTKLALGSTHSRVNIAGNTYINNTLTGSGGLLALPTNSGVSDLTSFSVMPELGLTLGYDLNCRCKITFGYTFLYWSGVMRPADQIDTMVNSSQAPPNRQLTGIPAPERKAIATDFWAQGFNVGLGYRY
jgi:hypothetical protein